MQNSIESNIYDSWIILSIENEISYYFVQVYTIHFRAITLQWFVVGFNQRISFQQISDELVQLYRERKRINSGARFQNRGKSLLHRDLSERV